MNNVVARRPLLVSSRRLSAHTFVPPRARRVAFAAAICALAMAGATMGVAGEIPLILRAAQNVDAHEQLRPFQQELLRTLMRSGTSTPGPAVCFAPGTSPEVIERFHAAQLYDLDLYRLQNRWSITATSGGGLGQGDPTTLTWSILPDGTSIPGAVGEPTAPSNLVAFLNGIYGSQANWLPLFQEIFDRYAQLTGLRYTYQSTDNAAAFPSSAGAIGLRGDVRIGGHAIDGNSGVLAYNYYPDAGDMVIDTNDSFYSNTANNSLRLRNVLAHEHGHGLGVQHVCPGDQTKLMEPFVSVNYYGPQLDDILAVNRSYGDRYENNNTAATAAAFSAPLPNGVASVTDVSIDDDADVDFYSFNVAAANKSARLTLVPVGASYLEGPQNSGGSCSAGVPFDSRAIHDLGIQLLGSNGVTVLGTGNSLPAGKAEELPPIPLPNGTGPYYIRVFGSNVDNAQLYSVEIEIIDTPNVAIIEPFGSAITAENCPASNGTVDTNETVTVNLSLRNVGGVNTTNLIATLQSTGGVVAPSGPVNYGAITTGGGTATRAFSFTVSATCGSMLTATLQLQDGATNLGTVSFDFTVGTVANTVYSFNNTASVTTPDCGAASPYPSTINVSGLTNPVTKTTATLNGFNHAWPSDLDILLVGPGGKAMLMSDAGGSTAATNLTLTFDDSAGQPLPGAQLSSGTFRPTDFDAGDFMPSPAPAGPYGSALSAFNSVDPNGAWSLYVFDDACPDTGTITGGWTLNLTTSVPACCSGPLLQLSSVVSRKQHGEGGPSFDIDLPADGSGVECRAGGATNAYTLIYTFTTNLASVAGATITPGAGTVSSRSIGPAPNQYTVNLTQVTSPQLFEVRLSGVQDTAGATLSNAIAGLGVLVGDSNGDRAVNAGDALQTRNRSGETRNTTNFRSDVNADGNINAGDATVLRARSGTSLP